MVAEIFRLSEGSVPLLVNMPHLGTAIPAGIAERMTEIGRASIDTDWYLDQLYDFLADLGAWTMAAVHSRYVVDVNRHPDNVPSYTNMRTPGLVPTETFDGEPLYMPGEEPDANDIAERLERDWRPYHENLREVLDHIRSAHGIAVLFDCHSIRSLVPRYTKEQLPDLNVGTADLTTCAPELRNAVVESLQNDSGYSIAVDAIFKGGYIPRHYGQPSDGIHAFQLELSMATYMDEDRPAVFNEEKARCIRPILKEMVETAIGWALDHAQSVSNGQN